MIIEAVGSGTLVGFTLGLIGGGGSILATPLLLYFVGVKDPHTAIGTSAVAVAINAYANLASHALKGNVRWTCAALFAGSGLIGSLAGSTLGKAVDGHKLLFLFGLLMMAIAVLMLRMKGQGIEAERRADGPTCLRTAAYGVATGGAAGFFGIGGGFLIVPALIAATGMPMINAIGSSLLAVGTFGAATAANYALSGLVDWPVAMEFIAGGVLGGLFGLRLATRLSGQKQVLSRLFALLVMLVALYVLYRSGIEIIRQ